jgi:hypothetical protein
MTSIIGVNPRFHEGKLKEKWLSLKCHCEGGERVVKSYS